MQSSQATATRVDARDFAEHPPRAERQKDAHEVLGAMRRLTAVLSVWASGADGLDRAAAMALHTAGPPAWSAMLARQ